MIEIPLTKGFTAIVDDEDGDLAEMKWCVSGDKNYVVRRDASSNKFLYLHRAVLSRVIGRPLVKGDYVDHVNHNGHDNRRINLRLSTCAQNNWNKRLQSSNITGYKGISFDKRRSKWVARIKVNGRQIWLGEFHSKIDGVVAYNEAALLYFGEFAYLNPIPDEVNS